MSCSPATSAPPRQPAGPAIFHAITSPSTPTTTPDRRLRPSRSDQSATRAIYAIMPPMLQSGDLLQILITVVAVIVLAVVISLRRKSQRRFLAEFSDRE